MTPRQRAVALKAKRAALPERQAWERSHPSFPRSRLCRPMSSGRERQHWRSNRKRWLRRHDVWPKAPGPLPLFRHLVRRSRWIHE